MTTTLRCPSLFLVALFSSGVLLACKSDPGACITTSAQGSENCQEAADEADCQTFAETPTFTSARFVAATEEDKQAFSEKPAGWTQLGTLVCKRAGYDDCGPSGCKKRGQ